MSLSKEYYEKVKLLKVLSGHTNTVYDACYFVCEGKGKIISVSFDYCMSIWDLETFAQEKTIKHSTAFYQVKNHENEYILTTDWNGELLFWNSELSMIKSIRIASSGTLLRRLTRLSDQAYAVSCELGVNEGDLKIVYVDEPSTPAKLIFKHPEGIKACIQLLTEPDVLCFGGGRLISKKGKDFSIRTLNWKTEKLIRRIPMRHHYCINSISSYIREKDGMELILCGSYHLITINHLDGTLYAEFSNHFQINCFFQLTKEKWLCAGGTGKDGACSIINTKTKQQETVKHFHTKHIREFFRVDKTDLICSCSSDSNLILYKSEYPNLEREERKDLTLLKLKKHTKTLEELDQKIKEYLWNRPAKENPLFLFLKELQLEFYFEVFQKDFVCKKDLKFMEKKDLEEYMKIPSDVNKLWAAIEKEKEEEDDTKKVNKEEGEKGM